MGKKLSLSSGLLALASLVLFPTIAKADAPPAPTVLGPANYVNGSIGSNTTPTLTFTLPDPSPLENVRYRIQISANSDFSSPLTYCTSVELTPGNASYTVGEQDGMGDIDYCDSFDIDSTANESYYWRVASMNALNEQSAWTTANSGSVGFVVNAMPTGTEWSVVGNPSFSDGAASTLDMAFHPVTHEPYAVFAGDSLASVMRYNGTAWVAVGSPDFSADIVHEVKIAFDPDDNSVHVALQEFATTETDLVSVMRYNGTSWSLLGGKITDGACNANLNDFAFDTSDPYVLINHCGNTQVVSYDGSSWGQVGADIMSPSLLEMHPVTNNPWVAAYDSLENAYKVFSGPSWTQVGGSINVASFYSFAFAFNSSGDPYIAYSNPADSYKLTVRTYDGSSWVTVGSSGFSSGGSSMLSMVFDPGTDEPYIAYKDGSLASKAVVMKFDGTDWTAVGTEGFTLLNNDDSIAMAFHPDTNEPWVAFSDFGGGGLTVMEHETPGGGGGGGTGGGTNPDGSSYFYDTLDLTLDINATISLSCDPSVTMNAIVGTGKSATDEDNQANCTVATNNSGGYKMEWQASTDDMINGTSDSFAAYTPAASTTPETWNIVATSSGWGAKLAAGSVGYNGGVGGSGYTYPGSGWGSDDTYTGGKFLNVATTPFQIMQKSTETNLDGEIQSIMFAAEIGADKLQPTGTYTVNVTVTATTL